MDQELSLHHLVKSGELSPVSTFISLLSCSWDGEYRELERSLTLTINLMCRFHVLSTEKNLSCCQLAVFTIYISDFLCDPAFFVCAGHSRLSFMLPFPSCMLIIYFPWAGQPLFLSSPNNSGLFDDSNYLCSWSTWKVRPLTLFMGLQREQKCCC